MNFGKRTFAIVSAFLLPALCSRADDRKIDVNFAEADGDSVLWQYGQLTGRKVWRTLDLRETITLKAEGEIPVSAAAEFIRTALLERYGIELRDTEDRQAFASWTDNPKYTAVRDGSKWFKGFHPKGLAKPEASQPAPPVKPEEERKIPLQLRDVHVLDVLALYEKWTSRRVWVPLDLRGEIALWVRGQIPKSEAVESVRGALLEQCGIELRELGDKDLLATWSDNPKYKEARAAAQRPKAPKPASPDGRPRVRVIEDRPKPPK